jgi:carbon monoxide dehydrogenase subunit G
MELLNEFTVEVPVDEAWAILTDVTRIAPCMPGAQLLEVAGDEYRGLVKVKVGPVTAEYRGKVMFVEQDPVAYRAVLRAEGRETRGQGNANATITATLEPVGGATKVVVSTNLTITGRVAQFGRGVLADVSNKLLSQFVTSLESMVLADSALVGGMPEDPTAAGPARTTTATDGAATGPPGPQAPASRRGPAGTGVAAPGTSIGEQPAAAPVDLVSVVGPALVRRLLPVFAGIVALWVLWRARKRRARR